MARSALTAPPPGAAVGIAHPGQGLGTFGAPGEETDMHMRNGTPANELPVDRWVKSRYSTAGHCVELGKLPDGSVAIRNSRDPQGPALVYTRAEIEAFLKGAAAGEFDSFAR